MQLMVALIISNVICWYAVKSLLIHRLEYRISTVSVISTGRSLSFALAR